MQRATELAHAPLHRPASSATVAAVGSSKNMLKPSTNTIVFVAGPPGIGKGTQCALLRKALGFTHLSTGYMLRMEVAKGSELGQQVEKVMADGGLVADSVVLELLLGAVAAVPGPDRRVLIDGFPISSDQAAAFEKAFCSPVCVLAYEAPVPALEARILDRARTSGRDDDNLETFHKRLETFQAKTMPVLDRYGALGLLRRINANRPADDIFTESVKQLEGIYNSTFIASAHCPSTSVFDSYHRPRD